MLRKIMMMKTKKINQKIQTMKLTVRLVKLKKLKNQQVQLRMMIKAKSQKPQKIHQKSKAQNCSRLDNVAHNVTLQLVTFPMLLKTLRVHSRMQHT